MNNSNCFFCLFEPASRGNTIIYVKHNHNLTDYITLFYKSDEKTI